MSYLKVKQGKYYIADYKDILITGGLASCTALGMRFKYTIDRPSLKFLCHIDANTNIHVIIEEIKKYISNPSEIQDVHIWSGSGIIMDRIVNSDKTTKMAYDILEAIGVRNLKMEDKDLIDLDELVKCGVCNSISGTFKIITHYCDCKYKERIKRIIVDYMEDVEI